MVPLNVVVRYEFSNGVAQCILSKEDHPVQTAFFDATDEAFGVGIVESRRMQLVWETHGSASA
jgi:hypothetical protein